MNKIKKILSYIGIFSVLLRIYEMLTLSWKETGITISLLFGPIVIVSVLFNLLLLSSSFLIWDLPNNWYLPFISGGSVQRIFDRLLLLTGILLVIDNIIKERW